MIVYLTRVENIDKTMPSEQMYDRIEKALPKEKFDIIKDRKISLYAYNMLLEAVYQRFSLNDAVIVYSEKGKPYFRNYPNIYFSISHSEDYAVCVLDYYICGVDIELRRNINNRVFSRVLSPSELLWVNSEDYADKRNDRFLRLWTMKEALLKASGKGISVDLRSISLIKDGHPVCEYENGKFLSFETGNCIWTVYGNSKNIQIKHI